MVKINGKELEEKVKVKYKGNVSLANPNPEAVLKVKSLEDLEVGDMFISPDGEKHKVSGIEDITFKVDDCENIVFTLNYLKRKGYKFYNPNGIQSLSPSEAETLLKEKLGYKVKIK